MTFDEGAEHGVDFFGFFDPRHADFLFDEAGFDADVDLSAHFSASSFGDRHESRHFRTTVAFTTFCDIGGNRQPRSSDLITEAPVVQ